MTKSLSYSGNNFLYGFVSLNMFKITLNKKVVKIQYITTYSISDG